MEKGVKFLSDEAKNQVLTTLDSNNPRFSLRRDFETKVWMDLLGNYSVDFCTKLGVGPDDLEKPFQRLHSLIGPVSLSKKLDFFPVMLKPLREIC